MTMMAQRTKPKISSPDGERAKMELEARPRASSAPLGTAQEKKPLADALAKLIPDDEEVRRYLQETPDEEIARIFPDEFLSRLTEQVIHTAPKALLRFSYDTRQQLLSEVANMQEDDGIAWFWRKWRSKLWPETPHELIGIKDELRMIWRLNNAVRLNPVTWLVGDAPSHYPPDLSANQILNKWLSWRPSAEQEQAYKAAHSHRTGLETKWLSSSVVEGRGYDHSQWLLPDDYIPVSCWLPDRRFVPDTRSLRPMLTQGVLEHWGHFKYCANPNCVTPYFIAKRRDQTVCDAEICKAEKQREHARNWWNEHRAKKGPKQAKVDSKPTMRRSRRNVARKAR